MFFVFAYYFTKIFCIILHLKFRLNCIFSKYSSHIIYSSSDFNDIPENLNLWQLKIVPHTNTIETILQYLKCYLHDLYVIINRYIWINIQTES